MFYFLFCETFQSTEMTRKMFYIDFDEIIKKSLSQAKLFYILYPRVILHFSNIFSQLNEVCEMQTQLHQKHYNINKITDKDNPSSDDLKNDLAEIPAVNEIFYEMKILSDKITALPDNIGN